ncbi:MAG: tRNA (adenosine(37)-N6)-threonylcarbamoyltransferase complex dimerization subunit type 1 TsaB [Planctomycetota bacterium]|nr:tRNA (adenosine(37)-N6)-threonylcarbamoyltransferase complex dimerization subunit type 1 TsaB [Planctomycetota bacterium]
MTANDILSIAIETTCRAGGVALGVGNALGETIAFDAQRRHATQLVARLADLLARAGAKPCDVRQLYVSAGPGGFTGTRVGITVARTLAQVNPHIQCVAVPTPEAVLAGASGAWEHLAVVLDAGKGLLHATLYSPSAAGPVQAGPSRLATAPEFLADSPRPLTLMGEGLAFHALAGEGVAALFPPDDPRHLPTPANVWAVGRRMAAAGQFTDYHLLLPQYARAPEAVRIWEERNA